MNWKENYKSKLVSVKDAAAVIKSNDRIWTPPCASAAPDVLNALCERYQELENVTVISGLLMYPFEFLKPQYIGHIKYHSIFVGPLERKFMPHGNIEATSYQFCQTDWLTANRIKPNILLLECSPPDERGYMSFGPLGAFNSDVIIKNTAEKIIVQVNSKTPYVYGRQNTIHVADVDYICEKDHDLPELPTIPVTDLENQIASFIVERIADGSTIQIGLGGIANAVGYSLESKKDLGVHTEMLVDSMVHLAQKGVINCKKKTFHPGKMLCGFGLGSRKVYEFMDRNPLVETAPTSYVNDPYNIAKNDNFVSINNALTVDLTGQVCSESLGFNMFSGTGGQVDFVRGAGMAKNGQTFIALKSYAETKKGMVSRITARLAPGTAVTTLRTDVQYVVTEYGIADLKGQSIEKRVKALINIAHPNFRDDLMKEAKEVGLLY